MSQPLIPGVAYVVPAGSYYPRGGRPVIPWHPTVSERTGTPATGDGDLIMTRGGASGGYVAPTNPARPLALAAMNMDGRDVTHRAASGWTYGRSPHTGVASVFVPPPPHRRNDG